MAESEHDFRAGLGNGKNKEDDRRKRPEVEHYKPGAFRGNNGPKDGNGTNGVTTGSNGKQDKAEMYNDKNAEVKRPDKEIYRPGSSKGRNDGKGDEKVLDKGGGGGRDVSQGEKWDSNKKQKKPEMEHYMPKKGQETRQSEVKDVVGDKGKNDNLENSEKGGKQDGGGGGTGRHKRKGKGGGNKGTLERNKAQNQGNRGGPQEHGNKGGNQDHGNKGGNQDHGNKGGNQDHGNKGANQDHGNKGGNQDQSKGGNQEQGRKGVKQEDNKNRPNQNQDQVKSEKSGKISPSNSTGNKNKGNDGGKKGGGNKSNNTEYDKKEKQNKDGGGKNNQRDVHQNTLDRKKKQSHQQGEKSVKNQVQNDDIPTRTLDRDNTKDRQHMRREQHDGFNQDIPRERYENHQRYDNRQEFGRGRGERGFDNKPRPLSGVGQFRVPEPPQQHGGYHRGNQGHQGMRNNYNGHAEEWHGYGRNHQGGYGNDGRNRGESEPKHLNHNGWMGNKEMDGGGWGRGRGNGRGRGFGGSFENNGRIGRDRGSRNNSPNSSSRGSSRRTSPNRGNYDQSRHSTSRGSSPSRHTRVFHRNTSPTDSYRSGARATASRSPSPKFGRGGGKSMMSSGRGGNAQRGGKGNRDSRDLDGWSRADNYDQRHNAGQRGRVVEDNLWDPRGKPPSGRPKSMTPKPSVPPRFQRHRDNREDLETGPVGWSRDRVDSENSAETNKDQSILSGVSDWSAEVEEEDERRSMADCHSPLTRSVSDRHSPSSHGEHRSSPPAVHREHSPPPVVVQRGDRHSPRGGGRHSPSSQLERRSPVTTRPKSPPRAPVNAPGMIRIPENINNPHWRPPPDSRNPAWRSQDREPENWRSGGNSSPGTSWQPIHAAAPSWSAPATPTSSWGGGGGPPLNVQQAQAPGRVLYDPKNPSKPIRLAGSKPARDRVSPASDAQPAFSQQHARFPMEPSRFAAPSHLLPASVPPGPGYRPPFPPPATLGLFPPGVGGPPRFGGTIPPPDWYDVYNPKIYGNGLHDVNCVAKIVREDMRLRHVLSGGPAIVCGRWDQEVRESRHSIMAAQRYLIQNDLMFVHERDVEVHIWKTVYYQVIEMLKASYFDTEKTTPENRETLKRHLKTILDEGVDYYEQLLTDLSENFKLDLERCYDVLEPRDIDRTRRLALISAQRCLLSLGDLARYREQVNNTSNYGRARHYYQKANHLEMRNGRPFNMLAILANINKRKFEAVYYNMRCLTSRNPFQASKESLVSIFEEMKRKWDHGEKKRLEDAEAKRKAEEKEVESSRLVRGTRVRREIWVRGEGGRRLHRTTSAQDEEGGKGSTDEELKGLSVVDLNRRFINTFLYLQGKLYTHINTDDIPIASSCLLDEFRVLIGKCPLPLSGDRLVQIMALNMYIIEETKLRQDQDNPNYRSVMQDTALQLAFDMFGVLLERCNHLLASGDIAEVLEPATQLLEDLTTLLAAVKVWCDWLLGNNDTWYPVVSAEPFSALAQLATRLELLKENMNTVQQQCIKEEQFKALVPLRREEYELIKLPEDALLCEFEPWFRGLDWQVYRTYAHRSISDCRAQCTKRIDQINMCVEYLEGIDPPVLKWSLPDNSHISLVSACERDETTGASVARDLAAANLTAMFARDEDILDESYSDEEDEDLSTTDIPGDEISRLRNRKEELERLQKGEMARARRKQREILAEHVSVTLEVRPKNIVPDTNAFIDHLPKLQELAQCGLFSMKVPSVVVNELEGLAKVSVGRSQDHSQTVEHQAMVRDNARAALNWLRDRHNNVKCVTSKGTVLPSWSVTSEEDSLDGKKNDDRILDCCLALDSAPAPKLKDGMRTVHRDTVLLTHDRNLKLKAHTSDCAVNKVEDFLKWANFGESGSALT